MIDKDYTFGLKVDAWIKKSNIKKQELADEIGINKNTLSAWISGRQKPAFENAAALVKMMGMTHEEFVESLGDISGPYARKIGRQLHAYKEPTLKSKEDMFKFISEGHTAMNDFAKRMSELDRLRLQVNATELSPERKSHLMAMVERHRDSLFNLQNQITQVTQTANATLTQAFEIYLALK